MAGVLEQDDRFLRGTADGVLGFAAWARERRSRSADSGVGVVIRRVQQAEADE